MNKTMRTFCPECDEEVDALLESQPGFVSVRREIVFFTETVARCPICGTIIGDSAIEGKSLDAAYAAYRRRHGILSADEIRDLRLSYGLSLREFSRFLGFGEQTVSRYERGDIPDTAHNNALALARSVDGARLLLSQNESRLSPKSVEKVKRRIRDLEGEPATDRIVLRVELSLADATRLDHRAKAEGKTREQLAAELLGA